MNLDSNRGTHHFINGTKHICKKDPSVISEMPNIMNGLYADGLITKGTAS